ncbi:Trypanosome variant surface glycoprotein (A-type), putative [Trypanosoma equiperdum]|uniref:Trypanosome variant surface glycoprotein (A-type), putative n=1 Tax=Trypanosoma equiperdum TaxID=5694 RepID=A0A1G4IE88_TRYEQ|nr:Trypanosome variant surface glycoprotein (A-type), putative [Trypanosoma equiperdum]
MKRCRTIVATFLCCLLLENTASGEKGGTLACSLWQPLVTFRNNIKKAPGRAVHQLNKRSEHLKEITLQSTKLAVYIVARNRRSSAMEAGPILSNLVHGMQEMLDTAPADDTAAIRSAATAEFLRGGITEFLSVAASASTTAGNGCLSTASARSSGTSGAIHGLTELEGATDLLAATTARPAPGKVQGITDAGFTDLQDNEGIIDSSLTSKGSGCRMFTAATAGLQETTGVLNEIPFALGYLQRASTNVAKTSKPTDMNHGDNGNAD